MKRLRAVKSAAGFKGGSHLIALWHPAGEARFEGRISDQICPARPDDFHIVQQAFAFTLHQHFQAIDRRAAPGRSQAQHARGLNRCPGSLGRLVAVGPVRGQPVIAAGID